MPSPRQFARNVVVNCVATLTGMLVPFFLSPFTIHYLGNTLYGVWVLIISSVVYFNLLDLGLRNAVISYVAKSHARSEHAEASRIVSAALLLRLIIGLVILVLAAILAVVFPRAFSIPAEMQSAAQISILLTAGGIGFTLLSGVAGAVLSAIHRFDLLSSMNIFRTVLRAGGFVWLMKSGHGIISLAAWDLAVAVGLGVALAMLCARAYPELRWIGAKPDRTITRTIWTYGVHASLITFAGAIMYHTDNIVVGATLSATAVTFYAIAGNLAASAREVVSSVGSTLTPMASAFEAAGKQAQLKRLLIQGTRGTLVVYLAMACVLLYRGSTFIDLWMGSSYGQISGTVLQILLVNHIMTAANVTACLIAYGTAKHKPLVKWAGIEAVLNLALSIILARKIGIYGVAWGTAIAGVVCNLLFWPRYITKLVDISATEYVWKAWGCTAVAAVPFAMACRWQEQWTKPTNLLMFFAQVLWILPILLLTALPLFWNEVNPYFRRQWARVQVMNG